MRERFLITGLPRSRTAWFAVATGAMHEPISRQGPGWLCEWDEGEGVSDSSAALYLSFILHNLKPRTLIIERDPAQVRRSCFRYSQGVVMDWRAVDAYIERTLHGLAVDSPLIKRVAFDDLHSLEVVEDCISWLGCPKPQNLAQLCHFRIESDFRFNLALLLQGKAA